MADRILTLRELNRATLARQMLLRRESLSVPEAVERLVGLQAQNALPPFVGLWTRLTDFKRDDLAHRIEDRTIIKATLMRGTLHLFTAADYLALRGALQPALTAGFEAIRKGRDASVDITKIVGIARDFLAEEPRSFAEISAMFSALMPDEDVGMMRYSVRTHLPLVQVPVAGGWSYPGNPKFTLADAWLGQPIPTDENLETLILRYLAAFGPATVADAQTWSGVKPLKAALESLRPKLVTYRDEKKGELFDLPGLTIPDGDTPAPARFLPEFDNLLLSHSKRTRVIDDAYRSKVYLPGLRVAATILVDGFVAGVWKVEKTKGKPVLNVEPFQPLSAQTEDALADEGERLLRFIAADAPSYDVRFV